MKQVVLDDNFAYTYEGFKQDKMIKIPLDLFKKLLKSYLSFKAYFYNALNNGDITYKEFKKLDQSLCKSKFVPVDSIITMYKGTEEFKNETVYISCDAWGDGEGGICYDYHTPMSKAYAEAMGNHTEYDGDTVTEDGIEIKFYTK